MFFRKKKAVVSEVDDSHQIVYDFRRRTQLLFESYRSVGYRKPPSYDFETMKRESLTHMAKLIAAKAVDAGNGDCLIDFVLGPVKEGFICLDNQAVDHRDFIRRQSERMAVDSEDITALLSEWKTLESKVKKDHERTAILWDKHHGYLEEGGNDNEKNS